MYIVINKTFYEFSDEEEVENLMKRIMEEYVEYEFFQAHVSERPSGKVVEGKYLYDYLSAIDKHGEWKYINIPDRGNFLVREPGIMLRGLEKIGVVGATAHVCLGKPEAKSVDELIDIIWNTN